MLTRLDLRRSKRNMRNLDAGEAASFVRSLEYIIPRTFDRKYAQLRAREFIPVNNEVDNATEVIILRQWDMVGMAKIIASYADDLPRADVMANETPVNVKGMGNAFGYNVQEIRASAKSGANLEARRATAARRAFEQLVDRIARVGDSESGLLGLLNQPNATVYTVLPGAGGFTNWSTKTGEEMVADLNGIVNSIVVTTHDVEHPDTIIVPTEQFTLLNSKRIGSISDTTALRFFLQTNQWIKNVASWSQLAGAGAGGTDRMVCYSRDPENLELFIPQEFEMFPPQERGLEYVVPCHGRTAGVLLYYPLTMAYGDGI